MLTSPECDRLHPACDRCVRRQLVCTGLVPAGTDYIFRDENAVAKRNSRVARGERKSSSDNNPACESQKLRTRTIFNGVDFDSRTSYPWLNARALITLPEPPKRELETRAVDRFFVDWVLHPTYGLSPGFLQDLPLLYYSSAPASALEHAVRAVAFADTKNAQTHGRLFAVEARRHYGLALTRLREAAGEGETLTSDGNLSALLLIDTFEVEWSNVIYWPIPPC